MKKVMVIEDDQGIVELLEHMLSFEGYVAVHAPDSSQAVDVARRESPDLILLDLMMPHVDGWQVLAALKKERGLQDIPVVLVTARADVGKAVTDPGRLGLAGLVVKPFDFEVLSSAIHRGLSRLAAHAV